MKIFILILLTFILIILSLPLFDGQTPKPNFAKAHFSNFQHTTSLPAIIPTAEEMLEAAISITKSQPSCSLEMKIAGYKFGLEDLHKIKMTYPNFKKNLIKSTARKFSEKIAALEIQLKRQETKKRKQPEKKKFFFADENNEQSLFQKAKNLYLELQRFKDNSDFHMYGFGIGGPYNDWLKRAEQLDGDPNANSLMKDGLVVGELKMLGLEYVKSKGKETEYTQFIAPEIKKALGIR